MKTLIRKIALWALEKYVPDLMVMAQAAAYERGKSSRSYKIFVKVGKDVGSIVKTVAKAGEDGVFTPEEREESRKMWQNVCDEIVDAVEEAGK